MSTPMTPVPLEEPVTFDVIRIRPSRFRRLLGKVHPASQLLLSVSLLFLIAELYIAVHWRLPTPPFAICGVILLAAICFTLSRRGDAALKTARVVSLLVLLKTLAVFIGVTGGVISPYLGLFYLPIFLSCLYYGVRGGAVAGAAICLFLWQLMLWLPESSRPIQSLWTQCAVFAAVSMSGGMFAERLRRSTSEANRRATAHAARARQVEWLADTEIMMHALDDLQIMLSVALMRVTDLLRCDTAVIYLRGQEEDFLTIAETKGLVTRRVALQTIPLHRLDAMRRPEYNVLNVTDTLHPDDPLYFLFAPFDPAARSVVVAPLKTLDELVGVLCVGSRRVSAFSEKDVQRLTQLSRHVIYPIQRARLEAMASTDALTGLTNLRVFRRRLSDEVDRAIRHEHSVALIMFDIDHFKQVNDTLGHRAGDTILIQIAAILRRCSRVVDVAARYGGEELSILCPEARDVEAAQLAERIRATIEGTHFDLPDGRSTQVTISAGVSMLDRRRDAEAALVEAADRALYRAKAGGRNRVCIAEEYPTASYPERRGVTR